MIVGLCVVLVVCKGGDADGCRSPAAAAPVEGRTAGAQGWIRYHRVPGMAAEHIH